MTSVDYMRVYTLSVAFSPWRVHCVPVVYRFNYTSFLYTMEPTPPFRVLATSSEFCLAARQDPTDCESIQFISGATHALDTHDEAEDQRGGTGGGGELVLAYGVNDCEARVGRISMHAVWAMLRPLAGWGDVCVN